MSIENLTLLSGPTISITGGTTQTFAPDGTQVNRGISVSDVNEADIRTRDICVFKNQNGALQSDGKWSKDRRSAKIVSPDLLPDGITMDFPYMEITLVKNPLNTAAKLTALKERAIQLINDSDMTNFWSSGSVK